MTWRGEPGKCTQFQCSAERVHKLNIGVSKGEVMPWGWTTGEQEQHVDTRAKKHWHLDSTYLEPGTALSSLHTLISSTFQQLRVDIIIYKRRNWRTKRFCNLPNPASEEKSWNSHQVIWLQNPCSTSVLYHLSQHHTHTYTHTHFLSRSLPPSLSLRKQPDGHSLVSFRVNVFFLCACLFSRFYELNMYYLHFHFFNL